jgi:hypothetical protein
MRVELESPQAVTTSTTATREVQEPIGIRRPPAAAVAAGTKSDIRRL